MNKKNCMSKRRLAVIIIIVFFIALVTSSNYGGCGGGGGSGSSGTPTGTLDTTFGTTGVVTTSIGSSARANAIVLQADGKIVAAGSTWNGVNYNFALVRYNMDGSLDTTFDTDGVVTTTIGSGNDEANAIVLQADGKIVAAGSNYDFALARYNTNGSLDTTFDIDGVVTTNIGSSVDIIYDIALQPDGKIVAAGFANNGISDNIALARYNTNGSLDTTFDTDGVVTTTLIASSSDANAIALQSDGKIVVAGIAYGPSSFVLARYNTNGSLDTTFDTDGVVITDIGSNDDIAYTIALQTDGKIVVAGYASVSFALARYNTNGSLDTTFNTDGVVTTAIGSIAEVHSMILQQDNKIVVAGYVYNGINYNFALARYWR